MPTVFAALLTAAAVLAAPKDATQPIGVLPIRVLIVTGYDHPAHKWRQTAPAVRQVLEKDKRFEVRIVEDPKFLGSAALADYDVILLHFMDWKRPGPGKKALTNLSKTIEQGKGLFVLPFACGAFGDYPEFEKLAGRSWDKKSGHDPYGPGRVEICKPDPPPAPGPWAPPFSRPISSSSASSVVGARWTNPLSSASAVFWADSALVSSVLNSSSP